LHVAVLGQLGLELLDGEGTQGLQAYYGRVIGLPPLALLGEIVVVLSAAQDDLAHLLRLRGGVACRRRWVGVDVDVGGRKWAQFNEENINKERYKELHSGVLQPLDTEYVSFRALSKINSFLNYVFFKLLEQW